METTHNEITMEELDAAFYIDGTITHDEYIAMLDFWYESEG
jgi:hypothetical protein